MEKIVFESFNNDSYGNSFMVSLHVNQLNLEQQELQ